LAFREEKGVKLCVECAGGEMDVRIELRRPWVFPNFLEGWNTSRRAGQFIGCVLKGGGGGLVAYSRRHNMALCCRLQRTMASVFWHVQDPMRYILITCIETITVHEKTRLFY
jgi:hypothetical protein